MLEKRKNNVKFYRRCCPIYPKDKLVGDDGLFDCSNDGFCYLMQNSYFEETKKLQKLKPKLFARLERF